MGRVAIADYGARNLLSVERAVTRADVEPPVSSWIACVSSPSAFSHTVVAGSSMWYSPASLGLLRRSP